MSSIGPNLPPHLQKRKRSADEDDAPDSPPSKTMRPTNNDEIALDDSSEDEDFGPSAGPSTSTTTSQHGLRPTTAPSPPHASIGPSMPPAPSIGPTPPQTSIGPSLPPSNPTIDSTPPPGDLSTLPTTHPDSSDSDSDDDYGPSLPTSSSHLSRISALPSQDPSSSSVPPAPKRDDWMLAPPTAPQGYTERDTTKLKARKFATGRAAQGNEAHAGGVSAIWTETPEEKRKRLRDAVLGRGADEQPPRHVEEKKKKKTVAAPRDERADEDRIRSYTEQTRGRSLYEEHQMRKQRRKEEGNAKGQKVGTGKKGEDEEEEDDPSKRAFSWEKDMKSSGTISHTQRRQLLAKSADFGGRFDKGRYL